MPPLESRDHRIKLADAKAHTKRHRDQVKGHVNAGDHGGAFHADQVLGLLAQKGCTGLRILHGRNEKGERSLILVGIDGKGADMTSGTILELCWPCPPICPSDSELLRD